MSADLLALATRVEALTGPDRGLDREIKEAVDHQWDYAADWGSGDYCEPVAFAYTDSLDAAMTLVPKMAREMTELQRNFREGRWSGWARLHCTTDEGLGYSAQAYSATPALALTAAALRARATADLDGGRV